MENKINIARLLEDCPRGMQLDCTIFNNVTLECVSDEGIWIRYIDADSKSRLIHLASYGGLELQYIETKCVIFPKGKTTWEGFQRPFKDGDVIFGRNTVCSYITIYKHFKDKISFYYYACLTSSGHFLIDNFADNLNLRLATEEEKEKLFQVIKDNGYRWNAEAKTLEKLPKFNDGDILTIGDTVYI